MSLGDGTEEKPKKTFSSALGINPETGGASPVAQNILQPQEGSVPTSVSAASLFTPPADLQAAAIPDPAGQAQLPSQENQHHASPSLPVSGLQPQQVSSMPSSQTITTPLSIPGMPPITVSTPLIMPPPMQSGLPTSSTSAQYSAAIGEGAVGSHQNYAPWNLPQSQQSPPLPTVGGFQTPPPLTANYHPRPVALFNPVANSTPTSSAGENFIRMYDPNNPMGQPAVSQS